MFKPGMVFDGEWDHAKWSWTMSIHPGSLFPHQSWSVKAHHPKGDTIGIRMPTVILIRPFGGSEQMGAQALAGVSLGNNSSLGVTCQRPEFADIVYVQICQYL